MTSLGIPFLLFMAYLSTLLGGCYSQTQREGFFNKTSYVRLFTPVTLNKHIGLSFRSCVGGQLFSQRSAVSHYSIELEVRPDGLFFVVSIANKRYESRISANLLDNQWHTVNILYRLGNLTLSTSGHQQVVANSTYNSEILTHPEFTAQEATLLVGSGFSGCILEGPSLVFNTSEKMSHNVEWGSCPLSPNACGVVDHCSHEPCMMHGTCISLPDGYHCQCTARYSSKNCEVDNGPPCNRNPCRNNGKCVEEKNGNYTCTCPPGYAGDDCEREVTILLCENNPCQNNGTCKNTGSGNLYECICKPGFTGKDCEININECLSSPCQHGGTCIDSNGGYECICHRTGYTGEHCEMNINECENNPCLNNGVCFDNYGGYTCQCTAEFSGQNCELKLSECSSAPCIYPNTVCIDTTNGYQCVCKPGYAGLPSNCTPTDSCGSMPCVNGATCRTTANGFICICLPGFTGRLCEMKIDDCISSPCQNGGTCFHRDGGYKCNCTSDFMGNNCEYRFDACAFVPCRNNGTCIPKTDKKEYYCECLSGFEGTNCENNMNDCIHKGCPEDKVCVHGLSGYECRCANGLTGQNCSIDAPLCSTKPCFNGATCIDSPGNYTCVCAQGFTGQNCEIDINECEVAPGICNNGICVNQKGGYQCFCTPGFSGSACEIDFDECLSHPCLNGATCMNKINEFNCICTPGYTGKDCSVNINECDSNPCVSGSTCIDEIATFSCHCPVGLTGRLCETNIDDCASSPCLNNGTCIDGLNSYTCDCSDTGYEGVHCEMNIDECASNPCINGGKCIDNLKEYSCQCYPGYEGINCEKDINECESNPCENNGTCLERSNLSYYNPEFKFELLAKPTVFSEQFNYSLAAGFECLCEIGFSGDRCEININECESSPCKWGNCIDKQNGYKCECEDGFTGVHCEIDIDECEKYKPCVHGTCIDKRAGYFCECDGKYGGKNCSVELIGCLTNPCLNNGTCRPYLENETMHRFNCSCPNGFQGQICEKITTMSLNGSDYVLVNTTREEGYDIQLRFKTTLPSGLLALGKGPTFYILELSKGRLNLHSSLLNKWEGVFIGSGLNDSKWQKVFVAINSSHLVLAANEEQTIYPINLNEGTNSFHTSFLTTYLGGTISYLRKLSHGPPFFIGCTQDVMINGQWVLPHDSGKQPVSYVGVEVGCKREAQCSPNPCHNGGHCTDLWRNFSCTCERPFLGHTCQYNLTAATFGNENITESVVTVTVEPGARRAVRSILDISMFIRTREQTGGIFYLGSLTETIPYSDQTVITAKLYSGELQVGIQFNATAESYTVGGVKLDNGYNHLIQVVRNVTLVQVKINGTEYFRKTISASGPLDLQILKLGAFSDSSVRNFKGIIQDVQVNNGSRTMVVEFYPLNATDLVIPPALGQVDFNESLVLEGVVSDDMCNTDPCMHGGTCTVTWNDFVCQCIKGYKGKECQEMEFCLSEAQDCPDGSLCRNLNHGYECVSNITLHNTDPAAAGLKYKLVDGEQSVSLNDVSVSYRSKTGGTILQVGPDNKKRYLAISVYKDQVTVSWNLGEGSEVHRMTKEQGDGDWVTIWLRITSDNMINGGLSEESLFSANFSETQWHNLLESTNVTIGGSDSVFNSERHAYFTLESDQSNTVEFGHSGMSGEDLSLLGAVYKGCIGEVRIGGLLLPYFTAEILNVANASARDHFELLHGSSMDEELGCMLCFDNDCNNGGKCKNANESYICECPPGYSGDDCSNDIDECLENDCDNNSTCVDEINFYKCVCLPGWEGTLCQKDIDECASNPCMNNGTCSNLIAKFECSCGPEFVGTRCEQLRQVTCDSQPCHNDAVCNDIINPKTNDNFTCTCQEGFLGAYCEAAFCDITPCQNNGICLTSLKRPVCDCGGGFTGRLCETNIDDCASSPCKHSGRCIDDVARYFCDCAGTGYTGPTCDMDINECVTPSVNCGLNGECVNLDGSYYCKCDDATCGPTCNFSNPCFTSPCINGGSCQSDCGEKSDYHCICVTGYAGKNCTEKEVLGRSNVADVALIVGPILVILLLAGVASLTVFLMMARKKRATRGTYSPSSQEYSNPRVELDNVMKPPPEERLI